MSSVQLRKPKCYNRVLEVSNEAPAAMKNTVGLGESKKLEFFLAKKNIDFSNFGCLNNIYEETIVVLDDVLFDGPGFCATDPGPCATPPALVPAARGEMDRGAPHRQWPPWRHDLWRRRRRASPVQ